MGRRVALDLGTADPSAARAVADRAVREDPELDLVLVGPAPEDDAPAAGVRWEPAAAPAADVDPAVAVRGRADLSVRVLLELARDGRVDAVVSASPLTALLTAARFLLRRRTGVRDPLVAVQLTTPGGEICVLDVSGRPGTTAGSLLGAAADLGPMPATVGLLTGGHGDPRAAAALSGQAGVPVHEVTAAEALVGVAPLVLADGAAGGLFVDTVRALAPDWVGASRVLGLEDAPPIWTVGPDPATWASGLRAAAGRS